MSGGRRQQIALAWAAVDVLGFLILFVGGSKPWALVFLVLVALGLVAYLRVTHPLGAAKPGFDLFFEIDEVERLAPLPLEPPPPDDEAAADIVILAPPDDEPDQFDEHEPFDEHDEHDRFDDEVTDTVDVEPEPAVEPEPEQEPEPAEPMGEPEATAVLDVVPGEDADATETPEPTIEAAEEPDEPEPESDERESDEPEPAEPESDEPDAAPARTTAPLPVLGKSPRAQVVDGVEIVLPPERPPGDEPVGAVVRTLEDLQPAPPVADEPVVADPVVPEPATVEPATVEPTPEPAVAEPATGELAEGFVRPGDDRPVWPPPLKMIDEAAVTDDQGILRASQVASFDEESETDAARRRQIYLLNKIRLELDEYE